MEVVDAGSASAEVPTNDDLSAAEDAAAAAGVYAVADAMAADFKRKRSDERSDERCEKSAFTRVSITVESGPTTVANENATPPMRPRHLERDLIGYHIRPPKSIFFFSELLEFRNLSEVRARAAMAAAAMTRAGGLLALERAVVSKRSFLGNVSALRAVAAPAGRLRQASVVRAEAEKYQVIEPLNGDPFIGGFETPVTSSPLIAWYLSNLPAYRTAVAPLLRGVEVGLAHGYFLVGPFVLTGPLRNTPVRGEAGSLAAAGLVTILTICLTIYGIASFKEGEASKAPSLTLTGRQKAADKLQTAEGWAGFTGGWFFGGLSGVAWAYILLYVLNLPYPVK